MKYRLSLLGILLCFAGSAAADLQWNIEEITSTPGIYRSVDLVLDQTDRPHVTYLFNSGLMYCVKESGIWEKTALPFTSLGSVDIELFSDGTPAFSTVEHYGSYPRVCYVYYDGSQWQTDTLGCAYQGIKNACMVIDPDDVPHVLLHKFIYVNPYNAGTLLSYYTRETSGWEVDQILSYNTVDEGTIHEFDLCMTPFSNEPRAIYNLYSYNCSYLDFAWPEEKPEYWNWLMVHFGVDTDEDISLAIDQNGAAHCCCRRYDNLYYSTGGTGGFSDEVVDSEDGVAEYSDIALDEMGFPHIVYSTPQGVRYAVRHIFGWQITDLTAAADIRTVSICVDSSGHPHAAWIDPENEKVFYAYFGESTGVSENLQGIGGFLEIQGVLPNPSASSSKVRFSIGETALVELDVYSADGRLVWEYSSLYPQGVSSVTLPRLETGVYILRAEAMGSVETSRFTVRN